MIDSRKQDVVPDSKQCVVFKPSYESRMATISILVFQADTLSRFKMDSGISRWQQRSVLENINR